MSKIFDEFKKYHSANYHDGDSNFDSQTYKKSNGDDFDCVFVQDCYDHFEAGNESRQTKIEEMEFRLAEMKSRLNDTYSEGQTSMYITKQTEIDGIKANHHGAEIGHECFLKQLKARHADETDESSREFETMEGMHEAVSLYAGELLNERDELQKRIDEALNVLCKLQYSSAERIYKDISKILKGETK